MIHAGRHFRVCVYTFIVRAAMPATADFVPVRNSKKYPTNPADSLTDGQIGRVYCTHKDTVCIHILHMLCSSPPGCRSSGLAIQALTSASHAANLARHAYTYIYIYICIYIYIYISIHTLSLSLYIYIYIEREIERERAREIYTQYLYSILLCIHVSVKLAGGGPAMPAARPGGP